MEPKYDKQVIENRAMSILFLVHTILPGELFFSSFSLHMYIFSWVIENYADTSFGNKMFQFVKPPPCLSANPWNTQNLCSFLQ